MRDEPRALIVIEREEGFEVRVIVGTGNDEDFIASADHMKDPRGLVDYSLNGRHKEAIPWKITGNLGGEQYQDHSRGPFNEGAFYAERQGYHLPGAPFSEWKTQSPFTEITEPGVGFWATSFDLDLPVGYDIPLSVQFTNSTTKDSSVARFRSELFVNGWQFGKYVNNVGPQTRFPVPEGIINYNGPNYLTLTIWSMDSRPFQLTNLQLQADAVIQSGYSKPDLVQRLHYNERLDSY
ncbi:beta-galactosidase [Penicillium longicatenatum]|uniref:beta-galactosidase n=1 Tax=Penicillium longicatenatum TaxID=1561947 RepID=UPI002546FBC4|nr:beta-galactosidase [Penicillium longicatenatum]KAJ5630273.1 beta-galactosidase [Penicillium longicatenatum]